MFDKDASLSRADPELWGHLEAEAQRQEEHLELIASENYCSPAVLQAAGSVLTNKYAEGYPGKRYYGGCEHVDEVEKLAIERVKKLFGAEYANVQPHSGSQANQAVYFAMLKPGDKILGMSLAHGGHLTHGATVNLSGKIFQSVAYGLDPTERIDYGAVRTLALEHKPKIIVAGASAYSRVIEWDKFRDIAVESGSLLMVDMAHYAGLIAAGLYPNPVGLADFVTSTTHKTLRGPRGGFVLARAAFEKPINSSVFPALQGGPLMHVIAAKAAAFHEAATADFKKYQQRVLANARAMAETLTERGLRIVSGGTDCHMFLVDLRPLSVTGRDAEAALGRAQITVNKNAIPNDPEKPTITSGIRIGSAALTTRGMGTAEAKRIARLCADALIARGDDFKLARLAGEVQELCEAFPVYSTARRRETAEAQ
ncbi:serine hydroxymethyltransferase [Usitatibacter palustris]|uniref:Serine hydroxymethyltransferase n=1 Tax=Usitatibacter palustris TaxID=2732487 RepID=A0A6M4H7H3_9PROT|nr:serine hydroxymethyltransferase [Usitatibacter palustris]QJR15510.1 Serine hydroxymethyltransferase [Usitatibacter palustris]